MPRQATILPKEEQMVPLFGPGFLADHAGRIIDDPKTAVVELVANAWDAGASRVDVEWPLSDKGRIAIRDDGTGLTREQFETRWRSLSYNRLEHQGSAVTFPDGLKAGKRSAFGRNGKGRHAMFCFSNEYSVTSWRDGEQNSFAVTKTDDAVTPFQIRHIDTEAREGHGTEIATQAVRNVLAANAVRDLIGSRFLADPQFHVYLNDSKIELLDLNHLVKMRESIAVTDVGDIDILCLDAQEAGRTTRQSGIAWWVNARLVGNANWDGIDGLFVDGRSATAKRYTFIVQADALASEVKADWSGFKKGPKRTAAEDAVRTTVERMLRALSADVYKERKRAAIAEVRRDLSQLSELSKDAVGIFIDDLQTKCPSMTQKDLTNVTKVLVTMEASRSGYSLLSQLANIMPDDVDGLHSILDTWTVREAQIVLEELGRRLKLIRDLEGLLAKPSADELHELQPLFAGGLWIFGPEYESVHFTSNRSMTTVLAKLFHVELQPDAPGARKRPDFIVLPNDGGSLGTYSQDAFDERGESVGLARLLIIELKRGGFNLTRSEIRQAEDYAVHLRSSGAVKPTTEIKALVLGTTIAPDVTPITAGEKTRILPCLFSDVLRSAHNRTFNLLEHVKGFGRARDSDVQDVLAQTILET